MLPAPAWDCGIKEKLYKTHYFDVAVWTQAAVWNEKPSFSHYGLTPRQNQFKVFVDIK